MPVSHTLYPPDALWARVGPPVPEAGVSALRVEDGGTDDFLVNIPSPQPGARPSSLSQRERLGEGEASQANHSVDPLHSQVPACERGQVREKLPTRKHHARRVLR